MNILNEITAGLNDLIRETDENYDKFLNEKVYKVYHGTNQQFDRFSTKLATQGIIWFTDSIDSIKNGEHGGQGSKYIMTRYITINNPAGWDEYEKYGLQQLQDMGYDGVILPQGNKTDFFVFNNKGIRKTGPKELKEENNDSRRDYLIWKRKNVTLRGMQEVGKENNGMASFGQGLYTAALSNRELARKYGGVYFVVGAIPKHPKVVNTWNDAEIFLQNVAMNYGKENGINDYFDAKRYFDANTNVREEMLRLGYDGLVIKGREMVNYTPQDVKYFKTENELERYYDDMVK